MRLLMVILICLSLQGCNRAFLSGFAKGLKRSQMTSQERQADQQLEYQKRQTEAAERQARAAESQAWALRNRRY